MPRHQWLYLAGAPWFIILGQSLQNTVQFAEDQCGAVRNEDKYPKGIIGAIPADIHGKENPHKVSCKSNSGMKAELKKNPVEEIVHRENLLCICFYLHYNRRGGDVK